MPPRVPPKPLVMEARVEEAPRPLPIPIIRLPITREIVGFNFRTRIQPRIAAIEIASHKKIIVLIVSSVYYVRNRSDAYFSRAFSRASA